MGNICLIVMNDQFSVLKNSEKIQLKLDPYPYIVIKDALPMALASELTHTFPFQCFDINGQNNKRLDISASDAMQRIEISSAWKKFIQFHTSRRFYNQIIDIFGEHVLELYKDSFISIEELRNKKIGIRHLDSYKSCDFLMDAQISINTQVFKETSVREIHLDRSDKLFSGLYYLRQPDDYSDGGDLQIFRWRSSILENDKKNLYQESLDKKYTELVDEIKFQNNVAILFLNSINSLHGVTVKHKTENIRTFANLVCETPSPLYSIGKKDIGILSRLTSFLKR